jgi:hypothetical protein
MTRRRAHIGLKTRLASALCQMLRPNERGVLVPVISFEQAQRMTEDEILAAFHFDHYPVPHSQGGSDHHSNIMPVPTREHQVKTAKIDIPQIAKTKRLARAASEHVAALAAKAAGAPRPAAKKPKQKIQQRSAFPGGRKFSSRAPA